MKRYHLYTAAATCQWVSVLLSVAAYYVDKIPFLTLFWCTVAALYATAYAALMHELEE